MKVADHILNVTYPLIQDPKLLMSVVDNVFLGLTNAMTSILLHDVHYKVIPPFKETFTAKLNMFRVRSLPHHQIDQGYVALLEEVRELVLLHRKSSVEFRRKDRFIICQKDYTVKTVTAAKLRAYVKKAKNFMSTMDSVIYNERISRRSSRRIEAS